jgi:hypothetical protein
MYGTTEGLQAYAAARGMTLAGTPAHLLQEAADYLDALEPRYQGERVGLTTAWPRSGVYAYGQVLADDSVPAAVVQAAYALAVQADSGPLLPGGESAVQSESIGGVISVTYANPQDVPRYPLAERLLAPLMRSAGSLRLARV